MVHYSSISLDKVEQLNVNNIMCIINIKLKLAYFIMEGL